MPGACLDGRRAVVEAVVQDFNRLAVWHDSVDLAVMVYGAVRVLPPSERFVLSSQMRRSAVYRFLQIAMGSVFELETQMAIAHRCGLIGGNARRELDDSLNRVKAKRIRLMQSLGVDR
jgi:hypothetical protein